MQINKRQSICTIETFSMDPVANIPILKQQKKCAPKFINVGKWDCSLKKNKYSSNSLNNNSNKLFVGTPKTSQNIVKTYPALAQVRDLVKSTAKELNHSRTLTGEIGPGYLFFGIVVSSCPATVDVSRTNVEIGHKSKDIVKPDKGKS